MSQIAYVNGAYVPMRYAAISINDRGFQFGDSIYEVWPVRGGQLRDSDGHFARMRRSLNEIRAPAPMDDRALHLVIKETMRRNKVREGIVYIQVSRGVAPRDHTFPSKPIKPTLIITAKNLDQAGMRKRGAEGVKVITTPEIRWARRDIKSVNLLPNILQRQAAKEAGAFEAWFVDEDGFITEGTSSNAWIVDAQGRLRTRPLSNDILHGVTRASVMRVAQERQMQVIEEPFTLAEAKAAREAFVTGAGSPIFPVIAIDNVPVGEGKPGPVTQALRAAYLGAE
ncbi:D-amino-acid transaminase [Vitreimonas flagellata]|uniref:D-amino-acid transaminase n=1 Tax=Vitreimonas flagellata TaxID=2560861 RepID=UPI0010758446|nr:D-amino-acid transaminase [Vitreimonas flagellata]